MTTSLYENMHDNHLGDKDDSVGKVTHTNKDCLTPLAFLKPNSSMFYL